MLFFRWWHEGHLLGHWWCPPSHNREPPEPLFNECFCSWFVFGLGFFFTRNLPHSGCWLKGGGDWFQCLIGFCKENRTSVVAVFFLTDVFNRFGQQKSWRLPMPSLNVVLNTFSLAGAALKKILFSRKVSNFGLWSEYCFSSSVLALLFCKDIYPPYHNKSKNLYGEQGHGSHSFKF